MRRLSLSFAALLLVGSTAFAQKQFGFDNRKASGQPYLTPAETVAKFTVPPEFEVKLFAGEPQVANPIAFTIDEKGRVWVVECFEYPSRTPKGKAPRDRIVILEDTDGDGTCDKRTVFAEGKDFPVPEERKKAGLGAFDMASGIEVGHGGVFVGAPPYLWFIENKNDKPGKFEVLLKGFGSQDTHETLNTFQWGPDGWLYGLHGIYTQSTVQSLDGAEMRMNAAVWRYHPRTKKFEVFAEGTSNPWGMDWRNTDGQFILACCVIPHLFHIVPGGVYKRQAGASNNPYAYGYIPEICDHTFHKESGWAHAGLISLDVPHMPEKYRNSVIFGSIHGCSLKQNVLKPNGSSFTASRADDFLQSGDKNVRPINLRWGPLGDIYMIDWHDQNPCHQAGAETWDYVRGRVYRIQLKGTVSKKAEDLGKKTPQDLRDILLMSHNTWAYRMALRLLTEAQYEKIIQYRNSKDENFRKGLEDNLREETHRIRDQVLRLKTSEAEMRGTYYTRSFNFPLGLEPFTESYRSYAWFLRDLQPYVMLVAAKKFIDVPYFDCPEVRRELASCAIVLSEFEVKEAHEAAIHILHSLMRRKEDAKDPLIPHLTWSAYEKTLTANKLHPLDQPNAPKNDGDQRRLSELAWLREHAVGNPLITDHIIPRVMRRLVATGQTADLALCVKFVADAKDVGVRQKALEGLATELAGRAVAPPEGWAVLRDELAKEPTLLPFVNKLAVSFRDPAAIQRALATAKDVSSKVGDRVEAVKQLGALKANESLPLLLALLRQDKAVAVQAEAARSLAAFDSKTLAADVLQAWAEYPKAIQPDVVNTLATRKEWAKALLTAMAEKKLERSAVSDNTIIRIQAFKDKELDTLIERAWGRTRQTPAELAAIIDKTRESLAAGSASFARGKLVFENQCAKCHKFEGRGADVGPALDGAGRDIDYILTNVLDPNRVIGAPYFLRIARTVDGRVEQGVLAEEDDKFVTLKVENGALKKIAKADLEGPLQTVEKSLMPEGLTGGMSPQDFRDLVRYLMAHPFLTDVMANGEPLTTGVPGRLTLPGGKGEPSVLEADITAAGDVTTKLLLGVSADYEVRLDGKTLAAGTATGKPIGPDQATHDVTLPKGPHRLTIVVKDKGVGGTVYARLLDPDRKLTYRDVGAKK